MERKINDKDLWTEGYIMKYLLKVWLFVCLLLACGSVSVSAATLTQNGKTISSITANEVVTGDEDISKFPLYTVTFDETDREVEVPIVTPKRGYLYIEWVGNPSITSPTRIMFFPWTENEDGDMNISSLADLQNIETECTRGTHYLSFDKAHEDDDEEDDDIVENLTAGSFSFRVYYYSMEERTLQSGVWASVAKSHVGVYKIKLKKQGHIIIEAMNRSIQLLDASRDMIYRESGRLGIRKKGIYFLEKGTYYIVVDGENDEEESKVRYTYYEMGASPFKVKNGKTLTVYATNTDTYQYIQYKANVTGYITFSGIENPFQMTLCDSKLQKISRMTRFYDSSNGNGNKKVYGVKKGITYYFRIKIDSKYTSQDDNEHDNVFARIKVKETAIKEKSGSSRKKALSLKAGKTVKGVIAAGDTTDDWYKFKVKKKKKIKIKVSGEDDGLLGISITESDGQFLMIEDSDEYYDQMYQMARGLSDIQAKLEKGTYYIKITRLRPKSSGYYKLQWK